MGDEHFTYYMTDAGETIVRDSLGYRLVEDDEEWQALLSEANGRRKAVRRKVGSAANASKIAKSGKFASITSAFNPTKEGDYLMVIARSDGNFAELERRVGGVRTINKLLQPNVPGAR